MPDVLERLGISPGELSELQALHRSRLPYRWVGNEVVFSGQVGFDRPVVSPPIFDTIVAVAGALIESDLPLGFRTFIAECSLRLSSALVNDQVKIRFNRDTSTLADRCSAGFGHSAVLGTSEGLGVAYMEFTVLAANAPANKVSLDRFVFPNHVGIENVGCVRLDSRVQVEATGSVQVNFLTGTWRLAGPLNHIEFFPTTGGVNFVAGSRITIYGLR